MKQLILLLANTITLIVMLVVNFLSSTGAIANQTVAGVSDKYSNLFTPAGYTFAIWGLIFLMLIAFVVFQWYEWLSEKRDVNLLNTGWLLVIANVANTLWIYAWLNEVLWATLILMGILLISLIALMYRHRLEMWDAPVRIIAFVWWPIAIYLGWIIVASVANVAVYLTSLGWEGGTIGELGWTEIMIFVATGIFAALIRFRNMREAAAVGVWALIGIALNQQDHRPIVYIAGITALALLVYILWHGYKNRSTSPFLKIRRGEV